MPDVFTKLNRSKVMASIRSRGNEETELALVAILKQHGIKGWRRHLPLFGRPDFVFRRQRLAIFVDGCFWHSCPYHGRSPRTNRRYWLPKLRRNKERDRAVTSELRKAGWRVLRLWAHSLRNPETVCARINSELSRSSVS